MRRRGMGREGEIRCVPLSTFASRGAKAEERPGTTPRDSAVWTWGNTPPCPVMAHSMATHNFPFCLRFALMKVMFQSTAVGHYVIH